MDIYKQSSFRDLERLNFTVNESKVYLTLLQIGQSYAGKIAKEAQLDRSSTYNALRTLIDRGVVSTIFENKRTIYVPEDPKKIIDYYKEKEEVAKRIIPNLQKQFSYSKKSTIVKKFKGYKGLKTIFQDILDTGEDYQMLGSEGMFGKLMPYYAPIFSKRKKRQKLKNKVLIRKGRKTKSNTKYTEYKEVPSDVESNVTINIYGDKVAIFIWEENPQVILIENEQVRKTLHDYFDFIWEKA